MRRFTYTDQIHQLPLHTSAWFFQVRSTRLLRQAERNNPGHLAVLYAEIHLRKALSAAND